MMILVMYCLFGCAICMYFRLWVCNTATDTVTVHGWTGTASRGLGVVLACSLSKSVSNQIKSNLLASTKEVGPGCLPLLGCYVFM